MIVMGIMWLGSGIAWLCYTPATPWLVVIPFGIFGGIGNTSLGTVTMALAADACDYDEFTPGIKDSGMFSAFYNWVSKLGLTVGLGLSGLLVSLSLWGKSAPDHHALMVMKLCLCVGPFLGYGFAIALLSRYSISKRELGRLRDELDRRRVELNDPLLGASGVGPEASD